MEEEERDCRSLVSIESELRNDCLPLIQFMLPTDVSRNAEGSVPSCDKNLNKLNKELNSLLEEVPVQCSENMIFTNQELKGEYEDIPAEESKADVEVRDGNTDNQKNWKELYRKLDVTIAEIFNEVAIVAEYGSIGANQIQHIKVEAVEEPLDLNSRDEPLDLESRDEPLDLDSRDEPLDLDSRDELLDLDSRDEHLDLDNRDEPLDLDNGVDKDISEDENVDPLAIEPTTKKRKSKKISKNEDKVDGVDKKASLLSDGSLKNGTAPEKETPKLFKCIFPNCSFSSNYKTNINKHGKIHYKNKCKSGKSLPSEYSGKSLPSEYSGKSLPSEYSGKSLPSEYSGTPKSSKKLSAPSKGRDSRVKLEFLSRSRGCDSSPPSRRAENIEDMSFEEDSIPITTASDTNLAVDLLKSERVDLEEKENHKCLECDFTTMYKQNLKRHMILRHSIGRANSVASESKKKAKDRIYKTKQKSQVRVCKSSNVNGLKSRLFMCSQCSFESTSLGVAKRHERRDHVNTAKKAGLVSKSKFVLSKMFSCFECDYQSCNQGNLRRHERKHRNFMKIALLKKRRNKITKKIKKIKVESSEENQNLENSTSSIEDEAKQIVSNISTSESRKRKRQSKADDGNTRRIQLMKQRGKKRKIQTATKKNIKSQNGNENKENKPRIKKLPSKNNTDKKNLQITQKKSGQSEEDRDIVELNVFKCFECSFVSKSKMQVKKHQIMHTNGAQCIILDSLLFKCSKCKYTSCSKLYVKKHMLSHSVYKGYRIFQCSKCEYTSRFSCNVKMHELRHARKEAAAGAAGIAFHLQLKSNDLKEKPFKCPTCDYATSWKWNLQQHRFTHLKYKYLKCSTCDYKTNWKVNLERHEWQHSPTKKFRCDACNFFTNRSETLKLHCENNH